MITRTALRFIAAIIAGKQHVTRIRPAATPGRRHGHETAHCFSTQTRSMQSGRDALGIAPPTEFHLDPNSPEATGGGSPGYNERL